MTAAPDLEVVNEGHAGRMHTGKSDQAREAHTAQASPVLTFSRR
jgi:hypothetical protein